MGMDYHLENNVVVNHILEEMYFKNWHPEGHRNMRGLELIISPRCNLKCKYCYINNFGHRLYPSKIYNEAKIIENTDIIIDWLISNKYRPRLDLFSGEIFAQDLGHKVIELIYEKYKRVQEDAKISYICVPTNFTFIQDKELTDRVQSYIDKFREIGIIFHLSASFDGKYMEQNRPYKANIDYDLNKPRDDEYYEKVFEFVKKNDCGLHPMVYSEGIELWKKNFLWFQGMMSKHGIDWRKIYLLQVRNAEWTRKQCKGLYDFVVWLTKWAFNKVGRNKEKYIDFLKCHPYGFNILKTTLGDNGRGLACSIQSSLAVRLGDLALVPCHRLMYETQEYGRFIVENGRITGIEAINPELLIGVVSHDFRSTAYCITCSIRDLCSGGCLGSQYEITGDPFTPIPTMCAMQHALAVGIIKGMLDIGVYSYAVELMTEPQIYQHELIRKELDKYGF